MNFKRRLTSVSLCLGIAAGVLGGLSGTAQAQTLMKISIAIPQNSHQGVAIDTFAKALAARTAGRYNIQPFYAGFLGAEREAIEAVQMGVQALTFTSTGPVPNFVPEARIFDIPYLFRDKAHARAVLDGPIGQEMLAKFDSKGFKALAWGENGIRHITNSQRAINVPEDLKGLKLRTMENPVHVAAFKSLGAVTTPMAFTDLFNALQNGTVDGEENPLSVIMAAKFDQVQKYLSLTSHVYSPGIFLMHKASFDALSTADQQAFVEAAKEAVKANRARVDEDDANGVAQLRANGMNVVEQIDTTKFVAALGPVNASFERQFSKASIDRIRNYK